MLSFLKCQFWSFICMPRLWMTAGIFWVVESFVFLLFLQPVSMLSVTQKMGILWGIILFSYHSLMGQYLTFSKTVWLFEMDEFFIGRFSFWFLDLLCLWCVYSFLFFLFLPVVCLLYAVTIKDCLLIYLMWILSSPVCFLQMYLASLIGMFLQWGFLLSLFVVLPWMIPEFLLVIGGVNQVLIGQGFLSHLCLLLGFNVLILYVLYFFISEVLKMAYQHAFLV